MTPVVFLAVALPAAQACRAVDGDHILMRDLATLDARFGSVDPDQAAGLTPEPNATRVYGAAELLRLARKNQIASEVPYRALCFVRRTRTLSGEEITKALRQWIPSPASIVVVSNSNAPVPDGELEIPRPAAVQEAADGTVLLRGFVRFGSSQRFPMWVRVRVSWKQAIVVANESIAAGTEIQGAQVRLEERETGIEGARYLRDLSKVIGHSLNRRVIAGSPVPGDALEGIKQVLRGAVVKVVVRDGGATLALDGLAESDGRIGEVVAVRNPSSGRTFLARVTGENAVQVAPRGVRAEKGDPR